MAHPWHHAVSSARIHGGVPEDYIEIHSWFDKSKEHVTTFRHRALRHHAQGIFECERQFGETIELSTCGHCGRPDYQHPWPENGNGGRACAKYEPKHVPVRVIGEQHVTEDLGFVPTLDDWLRHIRPQPWMNRSRQLSKELEEESRNLDREVTT